MHAQPDLAPAAAHVGKPVGAPLIDIEMKDPDADEKGGDEGPQ